MHPSPINMDMDHQGGGSMGMMDNGPIGGVSPTTSMSMDGMMGLDHGMTHMTFYWGMNAWILFEGFPGTNTILYILSLILIFLLAMMMEWLAHSNMTPTKSNRIARTMIHVMHVVFSYMLMLAVMSFNIGVFVVAVAGHGLGYYFFHATRKTIDSEITPMAF